MKAQYQRELQDLDRLRQTLQANDNAIRRRVQADWAREQRRLQTAHEDEERLRKEIATEVHAEIEGEKHKKGKSVWGMIPLLPAVVGIIEMFIGIPSGSTS